MDTPKGKYDVGMLFAIDLGMEAPNRTTTMMWMMQKLRCGVYVPWSVTKHA